MLEGSRGLVLLFCSFKIFFLKTKINVLQKTCVKTNVTHIVYLKVENLQQWIQKN
jgi:hypothetical protein